MIATVLLIIITIFLPPVGVFMVAGCGADVLINILLTCLGYFPGHIHAFYVEYMYFQRRDQARQGVYSSAPAPGIFSQKVQNGGMGSSAIRNEVVPPVNYTAPAPAPVAAQGAYGGAGGGAAGYGAPPPQQHQQQQYGTI